MSEIYEQIAPLTNIFKLISELASISIENALKKP